MEKTYTLTLSRWHKVAERLSREYSESVSAVHDAFTGTTVPAWLGEHQEAELKTRAHEAAIRLEWAFRVQDGIAEIRRHLGRANAEQGVSDRLAEFDKLNRRIKALTALLEGQGADLVGVDQLRNVPDTLGTESDRYDRRPSGIRVRLMDEALRARLSGELETLRARSYALADEISEHNRAQVALPLPADVARAAGL